MAYPAALDSFTTKADGAGNTIYAAHVNGLQTSVVNIETELGTDPAGSVADVKTRLAVSLADDGGLRLTGASTLTISGGVVTATNNYHKIDTESAAASDTLDTINGGADGYVLVLVLANSSHAVTVGHNTGNVYIVGGQSVTLNNDNDFVIMVYSGTLSKWRAMYSGKRQMVLKTKTTNYTALITDDLILCNATGGAFTITLPAVASSIGIKLDIKKTDASANAVTVDANSTELIDGAATYALTTQYQSVGLVSDGSAWNII